MRRAGRREDAGIRARAGTWAERRGPREATLAWPRKGESAQAQRGVSLSTPQGRKPVAEAGVRAGVT